MISGDRQKYYVIAVMKYYALRRQIEIIFLNAVLKYDDLGRQREVIFNCSS